MKISILTLFPSIINNYKNESILKRAIENNKVEVNAVNFRDYTIDKHKKVDDYPYGGGKGMLLSCQPIFDCIDDIKSEKSKIILMSPQGKTFNQELACELAKEEDLIFLCGHYEGFDERIRSLVDIELSIGDFVLTGGELPALTITDSIVRLRDGVIKEHSHQNDSFQNNLLDYPQYTKPREFRGMEVPEVLLSGHHKNIEKYRVETALENTLLKRPDLLDEKLLTNEEKKILDEIKKKL